MAQSLPVCLTLTANGAAQKMSANTLFVTHFLVLAASSNSGATIQIGDSTVSASVGLPIAKAQTLPTLFPPSQANPYDLSKFSFYGTSSDILEVLYFPAQ